MLNIREIDSMGEGPIFWYTFETPSFTTFIAEDERTSVNSIQHPAMLYWSMVSPAASRVVRKTSSIDILLTSFTNHVVL